jgi:predicted membrane protein
MIAVFKKPMVLLKIEGFAIFLLALVMYWQQFFGWTFFWSMVLLPDLALLGYFVNTKVGATAYNMTHSKLFPSVLAVVAVLMGNALFSALALIWFVHIGVDRMLGYGLKYPEGFKVTHLGTIGQMTGEPNGSYLPCGK